MIMPARDGLSGIQRLFNPDEVIVRACLEGILGKVSALFDREGKPVSARTIVGDFCHLAGEANPALLRGLPTATERPNLILIPEGRAWEALIESEFAGRFARFPRYATARDPAAFDRERLAGFVKKLPVFYAIRPIDRALHRAALAQEWSRDLCSNFPSWDAWQAFGAGFVVLKEGEPVCGAASYAASSDAIEIEIDTRADHRRRGLARAAAAKLILACLERGVYPGWDAANRESLALAEQLGYRPGREYPAYSVSGARIPDGRPKR